MIISAVVYLVLLAILYFFVGLRKAYFCCAVLPLICFLVPGFALLGVGASIVSLFVALFVLSDEKRNGRTLKPALLVMAISLLPVLYLVSIVLLRFLKNGV